MELLLMFLGVAGGLLNFAFSINIFFLQESTRLSIYDAGTLKHLSFAVIPLSLLGISSVLHVRNHSKQAGILMLVSAAGVLLFFRTPCMTGSLLLLLGGAICCLRPYLDKHLNTEVKKHIHQKDG